MKKIAHIIAILLMVYVVIFLGSISPISLSALNPFKKSLGDYESTDLVYSKFKPKVSFDERIVIINVGKPDRSKITQGINKLDSIGVKAIGIDVVFEADNKTVVDSLLQATIEKSKNLVLADEFNPNLKQEIPHVCHQRFCNLENIGYTNFVAKPDESIRYFSSQEIHNGKRINAFSSSILKKADPAIYENLIARENEIEQINYRGNADSYVHIQLSDLLTNEDLNNTVKDKIILLGYTGNDEWAQSTLDKYYTPMNGKLGKKTNPDMFGVLIHANILSMALDNNYINKTSKRFNQTFSFIITLLMVILLRSFFLRINPGYFKLVRLIQLLVFFLLFVFTTVMFYYFNLKVGLIVALAGVALSWDMVKIFYNIIIKRQKLFKAKV